MGMRMPGLAKTYGSVLKDLQAEFGKLKDQPETIFWAMIVVALMRHKHLTGNGLARIWEHVNRGDLDATIAAIAAYNDRMRSGGKQCI